MADIAFQVDIQCQLAAINTLSGSLVSPIKYKILQDSTMTINAPIYAQMPPSCPTNIVISLIRQDDVAAAL